MSQVVEDGNVVVVDDVQALGFPEKKYPEIKIDKGLASKAQQRKK